MKRLAAFLVTLLTLSVPCDAAVVRLILDGDPGEFVSQGQMLDLTYDSTQGSTTLSFLTEPIGGQPSDLRFVLSNSINFVGIDFSGVRFRSTQLGTPLALGTYNNAMRAPFEASGFSGLSVTFAGRGPNSAVNGGFTITELQIDPMGNLERFAATFSQFVDGRPEELRGSITYSAAVPEPGTVGALAIGGFALLGRRRWGRKS